MHKRQEETNTKASLMENSWDSSELYPSDLPSRHQYHKTIRSNPLHTKKSRSTSIKRSLERNSMCKTKAKERTEVFGTNFTLKGLHAGSMIRQKKQSKRQKCYPQCINKSLKLYKEGKDYFKEYLQKKRKQKQAQLQEDKKPFQKINCYQIIRGIGQGKFGKVYLAKHRRTGFIGAMKVINKGHLKRFPQQAKLTIIAQMISQIKIQTYLKHPNVIQLYDCFSDEDNIYLFLQLATDGQLYQLLQKVGKFSQETTALIVRQIAQGLHYIHSKDIIHRDLKLENIVFIHGMAKICDFGWSVYEPKNFRKTLCGTPIYLSPQVLKGHFYSSKIDVWVLGTITYELISGKNPFGITTSNDLQNIIKRDVRPIAGSPQARSFVDFVLRKIPEKRPSAEILLRHPFLLKYQDLQTSQELCRMTHCYRF